MGNHMRGRLRNVLSHGQIKLAQPVDGSSLAVVRITFVLIMIWFALKATWQGSYLFKYVDVPFSFKYPGFAWVDLSPEAILLTLQTIAGAGLFVALGLFYRVAAVVLWLAMTALF